MKRLIVALAASLAACGNNGNYKVGSETSSGSSESGGSTGAATTTGTGGGSTGDGASSTAGPSTGTAGTASSTGSGGTTGSSTGGSSGGFTPVSNAGCGLDAGLPEYLACGTNADCACPLSCQTDPALMESATATVCLYPCSTSSDCADPTSVCQGGVCRTRRCAIAAGATGQIADGGVFWSACDADGTGDGICLPAGGGAHDVVGICQLTGTLVLGAACDPLAGRDAGPGALCAQGTECLDDESVQFQSSPPFTCQAVCQVDGPSQCPSGDVCILSPIAGTMDGQLRFGGGEAFYDVCSAVGANGCDEAVQDFATQWQPCSADAQCACDQRCLADPVTGTSLCALPCSGTSGCIDPSSSCQGGACWPNLCDGGMAAACSASGGSSADGTCLGADTLPAALDPGANVNAPGGECILAGTAAPGGACDPDFPDRANPGAICQAGSVCAGLPDGGGLCRQVCRTAGAQVACPSGTICEVTYYDRGAADLADVVNACFPLGPSGCVLDWPAGAPGTPCAAASDCPCPSTCNTASGTCE
ncbi:MAG: hypothetical protein ACYDCL_11315 [Myxococcales bacterium]